MTNYGFGNHSNLETIKGKLKGHKTIKGNFKIALNVREKTNFVPKPILGILYRTVRLLLK